MASARPLLVLCLLTALPVPLMLWLGLGAIRDVERVDREQRIEAAKRELFGPSFARLAGLRIQLADTDELFVDACDELTDPRLARAQVLRDADRDIAALEALEPLLALTTPPRLRALALIDAARSLASCERAAAAQSLSAAAADIATSESGPLGEAFVRYVSVATSTEDRVAMLDEWVVEMTSRSAWGDELLLAGRLAAELEHEADDARIDRAREFVRDRFGWPEIARYLRARAALAPDGIDAVIRHRDRWWAILADRQAASEHTLPETAELGAERAEIAESFIVNLPRQQWFVDPGPTPLPLSLPASTLFGGAPARAILFCVVAAYALLAFMLVRAVSRQQRRSAALAQARADLVAQVTHELRTPLTVMRLYGESLLAGRVPAGSETAYLETIASETARLGILVDRVAAAAHAEHDIAPPAATPIDPRALVRRAAVELQPIVSARGGSLECTTHDRAIAVVVTPDALRLALDVLLDNALRYGGEPPRIDVSVDERDATVRIAVRDRGQGIPIDERERVFERFERGSAGRASGTRGAGMGLWLARRAAREVGGDVVLEFPNDGGTRAILVLPRIAATVGQNA